MLSAAFEVPAIDPAEVAETELAAADVVDREEDRAEVEARAEVAEAELEEPLEFTSPVA